jgi:hypothetical protein
VRRAQGRLRDGVDLSDEEIDVGARRVSKTAFTLFAGEAPVHLATLREEIETLKSHGIVSDAMLQSVHGLEALARGLAIPEVQQLTGSFALALEALAVETLSEDEETLVAEAVDALEQHVDHVLDLHEPSAAPDLCARLIALAPSA